MAWKTAQVPYACIGGRCGYRKETESASEGRSAGKRAVKWVELFETRVG
jgi:hypothetical protein